MNAPLAYVRARINALVAFVSNLFVDKLLFLPLRAIRISSKKFIHRDHRGAVVVLVFGVVDVVEVGAARRHVMPVVPRQW